jgi:hypothetical protein
LKFLHDHFKTDEILRILLTLKPDAHKSKTVSHLIDGIHQQNKQTTQGLYTTALYCFRALENEQTPNITTDDILDYLDASLSLNPVSDRHRISASISDNDRKTASRCYALQ